MDSPRIAKEQLRCVCGHLVDVHFVSERNGKQELLCCIPTCEDCPGFIAAR